MSAFAALRDRIAHAPTDTLAERSALVAAVAWVDNRGTLWPAMATWAQLAGLTPRGLQRSLRSLERKGLVVRVEPGGGQGNTATYHIPLYAQQTLTVGQGSNPDPQAHEPRPPSPQTPTSTPTNPDGRAPEPRPTVGGTTKNTPKNNHQPAAAVDAFKRFGIEHLRDHPNSTRERLAWIEREAPSKDHPDRWAAACIREGWPVPPPTAAQLDDAKRAEQQRLLAAFDAMPEPERATVLAAARKRCPNLANASSFPDDDPSVRGAVLLVLAERQRTPQAAGGAHAPEPALATPASDPSPACISSAGPPRPAPTPPPPPPAPVRAPTLTSPEGSASPTARGPGRVSEFRTQIHAERANAIGADSPSKGW